MSDNNLVSIVMPAYNASEYINEAIASVLVQTYQNWELIVVDDGSTDDTAAIVKQLQNTDGRIVYLHQTNKGLGAARNTALESAKGNWIAFLDADDLWHTDKLTLQMHCADKDGNIDVIFTQGEYLYQNTQQLKPYDSLIGLYTSVEMLGQLINHNSIPVLSVCLKKKLRVKTGLQDVDPIIKGCEDWDHWLRMCKAGATFYGMEERLFTYRVHEGGMSSNQTAMHIAGIYVLTKNYDRKLLSNTQQSKLKKQLISSLPLIIKTYFKIKNTQLTKSYKKLIAKILSISGLLLPWLIINKLLKRKLEY